jgi:methionyl aminopeptidase
MASVGHGRKNSSAVITLKSQREIRLMREAGRLVAEAHRIAREMIEPGVLTREIDAAVETFFDREGATPLFKNFPGEVPFPAVTCISINEQIVHGIPGDYALRPGDIVSLDTGCRLNGWCGDAAWTYPVGEVDEETQRLMDVGVDTLRVAVKALGEKRRWSQVAREMMKRVKASGFSLVEKFVGHGIGREMHEEPQVPNFTNQSLKKDDFELQPGLVLAVEPMVNAGVPEIRVLKDKWTAVTQDGKRSVHFEHTVALTQEGPQLLTEGVGFPLF